MKRLQTKRLLLAATLALLAATAARAQSGAPQRPNGNQFNGYVRTARVEVAYYVRQDGALVEGPRHVTATFAYTEDGKRCDYGAYAPDGTLRQRSVHVYDDAGRMIEQELYDGGDNLITKTVLKPDEGEILHYDGEGNIKQRIVTEKRDGGITEVRIYDASGALVSRTVTARGEGSISIKSYNGDGVLTNETTTRGAGDKLVSESQWYGASGALAGRNTETTDVKSKMHDSVVEKPGDKQPQRKRETTELDSRGNLARKVVYVWNNAAGDFVPSTVYYYTLTYYR